MTREADGLVELRILSGPHLGAAIRVGAGRYVFGSDDGCDFILSDAGIAPRHLSLEVSGENGEIRVLARPEDSGVALSGARLAAEGEYVAPGAPLALGFTALAWRPGGETWEPVTLAPLEYRAAPPEAEPEADDQADGFPDADPAAALAATEAGENHESRPAAPGPKRLKFWLGLLVLLLLLSSLLYGYFRPAADDADRIGLIKNILASQGFQNLAVEDGGDAVLISGSLPNDQEAARLVSLIRGQPVKVYLKVTVTDDRIKAVYNALRAHGFYPEVGLLGDAGLSVAAYMKDGLVEAKAFGYVDMDAGDVPVSRRHIVYEPQLQAVLSEEMGRAGLPEMPMRFADGHVDFPAALSIENHRRLDQAAAAAGERLGIPVFYRLVSPEGETPPILAEQPAPPRREEPDPPATEEEALKEAPVWPGPKVVGVTLSPLRFITASDGQKFFEGAVLANGFTIEEIKSDEIILNRDGRRVSHKLGD